MKDTATHTASPARICLHLRRHRLRGGGEGRKRPLPRFALCNERKRGLCPDACAYVLRGYLPPGSSLARRVHRTGFGYQSWQEVSVHVSQALTHHFATPLPRAARDAPPALCRRRFFLLACSSRRLPLELPSAPLGADCGVARIESSAQAAALMKHLPYFCRGEVVRGFGRGSKELGIPTGEASGCFRAGRQALVEGKSWPPGPLRCPCPSRAFCFLLLPSPGLCSGGRRKGKRKLLA